MRKTIISIAIFALMAWESASANPRIITMAPFDTRQQTAVGTPVGISIVFSEPVYGFDPQDIITNGRVLAVEGSGTSYRVIVVPNSSPLVLDVLVDAVRNVRSQGNDPTPRPLVFPLGQGTAPIAAPIDIQQASTRRQQRLARRQAAGQETSPLRTHFVMDLGINSQGPRLF